MKRAMKLKLNNKAPFLGLILLLIVVSYYLLTTQTTPAPDITFKTIDNKIIHLKQLQGSPVLITFWASNCPSCIKEIPDLKCLYQNYHAQGLKMMAVAMFYDRPNYVLEAQKKYQIPYNIALDLQRKIAIAFGDIQFTPTTLLIDTSGKIVYQITGLFDLKIMQTRIKSLLTQQGN